MTIHIDNETDIALGLEYEEIIKRCVHEAASYENCGFDIELSVVLTDNASILSVNKEFRNIDAPTDVLSFPAVDYDAPSDFDKLKNSSEYFDKESGELILGDIMISVEKVISQADEYGHSRERELAFLVVHSMLHLFGYDHIDEEGYSIMEEKQEAILGNIGILRNADISL